MRHNSINSQGSSAELNCIPESELTKFNEITVFENRLANLSRLSQVPDYDTFRKLLAIERDATAAFLSKHFSIDSVDFVGALNGELICRFEGHSISNRLRAAALQNCQS